MLDNFNEIENMKCQKNINGKEYEMPKKYITEFEMKMRLKRINFP